LTTLEEARLRAERDARTASCYLNPDSEFLNELLSGLVRNEERYGYPSCPCRLASATLEFDRDILCPCDYRDPDVQEHGGCYCGLYVRKDVHDGTVALKAIPERRPLEKQERAYQTGSPPRVLREEKKAKASGAVAKAHLKMKTWYCQQCGYMCFREDPPYVCPICQAKRDMFAIMEPRMMQGNSS
jgi:ferredoxin-thioredoxin reductase catalytic subunit